MRKTVFSIGALISGILLYGQSMTPEVIGSSGSTMTGGGNQIEFTIGEVATATLTASGNTMTQGFHQPEIQFADIEDLEDEYTFNLYPNPTEQFVTISSNNQEDMQVHIFDMNGKAIKVTSIFQETITIDLQTLRAGNYVVRVTTKNGKPLFTAKMIKNSNY